MEQEVKQYRITKTECELSIGHKVCPSCGNQVVPIETVDNSDNPTFWAGCNDCQRFSSGVDRIIFDVAKEMVNNRNYIAYSYMGVKENHPESEWPEWYRSQYSGTCSTVSHILQIHKQLTTK